MTKQLIFIGTVALAILAMGLEGLAQTAPPPPDGPIGMTAIQAPGAPLPPPPGGPFMMKFSGFEDSFDSKVVTGAPYSADAVTERTQVLADGNRIAQKTAGHVYRDNQGRTRREQTIGAIGPWGTPDDFPPMISINDPVAGVGYMLDERSKIAFKHPLHSMGGDLQYKELRSGNFVYKSQVSGAGDSTAGNPDSSERQVTKEALGKQTIEGVQAEGTRETVTMAAGAIGNDQPLKIVSERWYSPDLQATVMTKHSDPRFGETVYRLTNINREEPVSSLFEVPSDYTVKEGPVRVHMEKRVIEK